MQQTFVGTTYSIEAGQMLSGHKLSLSVAQCDDFASFWCKFILVYLLYHQNLKNLDPFLEISSNSAHSTTNTLKQIIKHYIEQDIYNTMLIHVTPISLIFPRIFSLILKFPEFSLIKIRNFQIP